VDPVPSDGLEPLPTLINGVVKYHIL
jgi:hypothetical protein